MVTRNKWLQAVVGFVLIGGLGSCKSLEVINPNAPERERAFSDPATIVASAAGTMKTWINVLWAYDPSLTLSSMSDSYSFSWNNFNSRYYSTYGVDCPNRCGWVNSTSSGLGYQVTPYWYGMYSMLSSANDALFALRVSAAKPDLGADKARTETIAQLAQAMSHAFIALNYDRGFIVLEDSDPVSLQLSGRQAIRDKAIELYDKTVQVAKATPFQTTDTWFGIVNGPVYTNLQIAKIARTMEAQLLAHYPRNAEENATVNWAKVAEYASQGTSSAVDGAPFDFTAFQDENRTFRSQFSWWGNDYTTVRVDTRLSRLLSTTQTDPWPGGGGNPRPADANGNPIGGVYGVDKRLGDGCFGAVVDLFGYGECKETALSGTDFMWSPVAIFIPGRGSMHQSNIGYIQDHCIVGGYPDCPTGAGPIVLMPKSFNDLLWAEGLIRTNQNFALAATLINNTRVTRGGLAAVSAADTKDNLLKALLYEQDVEFVRLPATPYFNRRRVSKSTSTGTVMDPEGPYVWNTIWKETPRQMPIPAKDLALLRMEIYSFGGVNNPAGAVAPNDPDGSSSTRVRSVREIWAEMEKASRAVPRKRPH